MLILTLIPNTNLNPNANPNPKANPNYKPKTNALIMCSPLV